jgi:hypothetical protein
MKTLIQQWVLLTDDAWPKINKASETTEGTKGGENVGLKRIGAVQK